MQTNLSNSDDNCELFQYPTTRIFVLDYRANARSPLHTDHRTRLSIVLSGQLRESVYGREEYASAGSIVFKPGDAPHRNEYGPRPGRILTVDFAADPDNRLFLDHLQDWRWLHGTEAMAPALAFVQAVRRLPDTAQLGEALTELLAALPSSTSSAPSPAPDWLPRTVERLQDTYHQSPRTIDLARELDLHPVYLARVFRRYYGCSVREFIQRIRLRRAIDQLATTGVPLAHVALDQGYADQSHFTREFRRHSGQTPARYRQLVGRHPFFER